MADSIEEIGKFDLIHAQMISGGVSIISLSYRITLKDQAIPRYPVMKLLLIKYQLR